MLCCQTNLRVDIGDARTTMDDWLPATYDFVIGDAFGGGITPWQLTTQEFDQKIKRVMTPDAIYAVNTIDYGDLEIARAVTQTLQKRL